MTVNEMVEQISETLSQPSPEAKTRIAREINTRYRRVTSSIGLETSRRVDVSQNTINGSQLITFPGVEKIDTVWVKTSSGAGKTRNKILNQLTNDEMTAVTLQTETPTRWSLYSVAPQSVTIKINCIPGSKPVTLYASAIIDTSTLSNNDQPVFPESYHDILIFGVLADEYRRREKTSLAQECEQSFDNRLSDLRMFIAKTAWLDIHRGKHAKAEDWWDYSRNT